MKNVVSLFMCICFAISLEAQPKELDRIVAVVGDSAILKSEVDSYVQMKMQQSGSTDLLMQNMLATEAIDELIDSRVLMVYAAQDTNVVVSSSEVFDQVESRVNMICTQNKITREQLAEALIREQGITYNEFREQMELQIRQEMTKSKVEQFYITPRSLSRDEVESFYENYKDSLPPAGESVRLQKMEIILTADSAVMSAAYEDILNIRRRIVERGKDFSEVAKEFSKGPNASRGGDLGFISKGTLNLIKLEEAIFSLEPGEVSKPIETKLGFHLIKSVERRDNKVHTLHIFVPVTPSETKGVATQALLDSLRSANLDSAAFSRAVTKYSTDAVSRAYGGDLGWQLVTNIPSDLRSNLEGGFDVGKYSAVYRVDNYFFLYRIAGYDVARKLTFKDDYSEITRYAERVESQKRLQELVELWRKDVFIKKYN